MINKIEELKRLCEENKGFRFEIKIKTINFIDELKIINEIEIYYKEKLIIENRDYELEIALNEVIKKLEWQINFNKEHNI